jgi:hypothetical protein
LTVKLSPDDPWEPFEIDRLATDIADIQLSGSSDLKSFIREQRQAVPTEKEFLNLGQRRYMQKLPSGSWLLQLCDWDQTFEGSKEEMLKLAEKYQRTI